ncbi:MAG TPA: hypothetical protein PKE40_05025 [Arachnia sp.]|nr:hypothetical protein [Arachnia sp.]HMT85696.1 hypothetical protein [Arachnia sp.]
MRLVTRTALLLLLTLGVSVAPAYALADGESAPPAASGSGSGMGGEGSGTGSGGAGDPATPSPAGISVPRVMVESFGTTPTTVDAGQEFTIDFSLRNTSAKTRVQNMKVTVESPDNAFLPVSGTSSLFISRIGAERASEQSMTFRALPSLEAKPYVMTVALEYEDNQANAYSSSETVAIVVRQELRASASAPQLMPLPLTVGQEASLTFSVQNQGKSQLYNAKVSIADGQALTSPEFFVGNIEPGQSGAVDMTVAVAGEESATVDLLVTYEDVSGNIFSLTHEVPVEVMAVQENEELPEEMPEQTAGLPWQVIGVIGLAGLALIAGVVVLVRRARRRKAAKDDAESLEALDSEPLVSDDWT